MRRILIALAFVALLQAAAAGQDKAAVTATVQRFVEGFNKGDTQTAAAVCAEQTSIIDEFSPYEWHGAGACARWMSDYEADARKNAITDSVVTLASPRHVDISGGRAYVVVPADYGFKQNGKTMKETGSTLTVVLTETAAGWRISAWSWAKN